MKKKTYKPKKWKLTTSISEKRILQLSNDLSENIPSGTVQEWRSVAKYFRDKLDKAHNDLNSVRPSVAALVFGNKAAHFALSEMDAWLKRVES